MSKTLVIVESPAKCKKIQGFLGPGYIVKASFGHITNIDKKRGLSAIDIVNNYDPHYSIIREKTKYIKDLQKHSKNAKEVIIASDLDREGEAIGYHLIKVLKLSIENTKRIVFNEITKTAIQSAIQNPRTLDMDLVNAQQARQVLDYLIGFDISPVLWKHVRNKISAGRCQSPTLKLICEKERSIMEFSSKTYFNLEGIFKLKDATELNSKSTHTFESKEKVLKRLGEFKTSIFSIMDIVESQSKQSPPAPYITSTIQQDASSKCGMSPKITMGHLQKLYEKGKITYMRTDSKVISAQCIGHIKKYVIERYGAPYYKCRKYANTSKNAQEAHECIRPVDIDIVDIGAGFSEYEKKLYSMIWKRTIACQMKDLIKEVVKWKIGNNKNNLVFESVLEKTVFLGYGVIYNYELVNEIDTLLTKVKKKDIVNLKTIQSSECLTTPPPRYTEASLIKDLEKKGIGRPSTFSSIVDTLFKRDYIKKETSKGVEKEMTIVKLRKTISEHTKKVKMDSYKNKIVVSELGEEVNSFMCEHFDSILKVDFTSTMETLLDKIARGEYKSVDLVNKVYKTFHPVVEKLLKTKSVKKTTWDKNKKPVLGKNPKNNKNIYVYTGKFGPVIQEGDDTPRYVGIPKKMNIENMGLEQCIELLEYPKCIGTLEKKQICIHVSVNGFYLKYDSKSYSIDVPPITLEEAKQKIKENGQKIIKEFSKTNISIRMGPYGPYVLKSGKKGTIVSIPKHINPGDLTLEECNVLLKNKHLKTK